MHVRVSNCGRTYALSGQQHRIYEKFSSIVRQKDREGRKREFKRLTRFVPRIRLGLFQRVLQERECPPELGDEHKQFIHSLTLSPRRGGLSPPRGAVRISK